MAKYNEAARATVRHKPPAKRHGIYFATRALPHGHYGISVAGFWRGELLFTDHSTKPCPTAAVALDMAKRAALGWAQRQDKSLPVIADISTTRDGGNRVVDPGRADIATPKPIRLSENTDGVVPAEFRRPA
jgi:hypothetical protein